MSLPGNASFERSLIGSTSAADDGPPTPDGVDEAVALTLPDDGSLRGVRELPSITSRVGISPVGTESGGASGSNLSTLPTLCVASGRGGAGMDRGAIAGLPKIAATGLSPPGGVGPKMRGFATTGGGSVVSADNNATPAAKEMELGRLGSSNLGDVAEGEGSDFGAAAGSETDPRS